jgi:site-specific recombinase XerD
MEALAVRGEFSALAHIVEQADEYARKSKSDSTQKAYRSDWRHFEDWCIRHRLQPLPANEGTVTLYLVTLAKDYKPATLQRRIAAISVAHKSAGYGSPASSARVRATLQGIRREQGTAQKQAAAFRAKHIRELIPQIPDTLQGKRDKALLLLGYACAFRRSEVVALNVDDLQFAPEGVQVLVRKSKTDQEGKGNTLPVYYGISGNTCPVKALQDWLQASGITSGAVFRPINRHGQVQPARLSDKSVDSILKRLAPACGLDVCKVSGHSLRAGFITDQYSIGTPEATIMKQSRHKSTSVMARYHREAELFSFNYTAAVGL